MGVTLKKVFLDSTNWEPINWEDLDKEKAITFVGANKMPVNIIYADKKELIFDIQTAKGAIALPLESNQAIQDYLHEMITEARE